MCSSADVNFSHGQLFFSYTGVCVSTTLYDCDGRDAGSVGSTVHRSVGARLTTTRGRRVHIKFPLNHAGTIAMPERWLVNIN